VSACEKKKLVQAKVGEIWVRRRGKKGFGRSQEKTKHHKRSRRTRELKESSPTAGKKERKNKTVTRKGEVGKNVLEKKGNKVPQ